MFIQGDLQAVFDALYTVGVIDPVLKMDWAAVELEASKNQDALVSAMTAINGCAGDRKLLIEKLNSFAQNIQSFIAVEVAREYAEFTSRSELH